MVMGMKITRIYTGSDNESHFEDIELALERKSDIDPQEIGRHSAPIEVTSLFFREVKDYYEPFWHNAPRRQFVFVLEGELEIEIGDGTKRRFGPGGIFLAEDTEGRGHISRSVDNQPRRVAFMPLD